MEKDIRDLVETMVAGLRARADPARRAATEGYFPTELRILGVSAGAMREVMRLHRSAWRGLSPQGVVALARALHGTGIHEARQVGYETLERRADAMALLDRPALEALGAGNDNWASVDAFATRVAGPAWRDGRVGDAVVREWARAADRWWRRAAVVCTVALNTKARGGAGDPGRTLDICQRVAADPDPMVAKGLSWALRSLVVHDPAGVRAFLEAYESELAARVKREVTNKLETGKKNP